MGYLNSFDGFTLFFLGTTAIMFVCIALYTPLVKIRTEVFLHKKRQDDKKLKTVKKRQDNV